MSSRLNNLPGDRVETASSKPQPRKKIFKITLLLILLTALVAAADGLFVEPYRVEVNHYDVQGAVESPLKLAHLSDLHALGMGRREHRLLEILADEKPDVILITGDTLGAWIGTPANASYAPVRQLYEQLHAPLGVWFVRGNWENSRPLHNERAFYQAAGVNLLVNSSASVRPDVWLAGLDDPESGVPRLDLALAGIPASAYTIVLFHSPFFFRDVAGRANLALAGHTHGGQVRIPFVKPLWLPRGSGQFLEGWYERGGTRMYVSRGLGTSGLPIRFHCRPEITIITIHP
jgi:predicted MPP superfamily phosphohydrolase